MTMDNIFNPVPHQLLTMEFTQASHGNIQLIMGPMFAGKSTELVRRIRKYAAAK